MKDVRPQSTPASVPRAIEARQVGDVRARWDWTEAAVWTDRMLTALEQGVKGGIWFSLIDKVYRPGNLQAAFAKVKANGGSAGVDHQTIARFERDLERNLMRLSDQLQGETYHPQPIRRAYIPKPGGRERRPLGIPTVCDRVVQTALRQVIEPIFERDFAEHSYGFRPGRGCKDALRRVNALLTAGYVHVVDVDFKSYFDTIPHDRLMAQVRRKIADGRMLRLIGSFLTQGVLDGLERWMPTAGSPQGAVISPLLSNIYLDPLDQQMAAEGFEMVRYADDLVILCRDRASAEAAWVRVQEWAAMAGLTLHPDKTRLVDLNGPEGFDFLGYHFQRDQRRPGRFHRWPREKSIQKLRDVVRAQTPQVNGRSLQAILATVNGTLRGWFAYFQHTNVTTVFPALDGWLRRRLRRILLKRHKCRRHQGQGLAHQRWPNAYFARQGLFSLATAHASIRQSARR